MLLTSLPALPLPPEDMLLTLSPAVLFAPSLFAPPEVMLLASLPALLLPLKDMLLTLPPAQLFAPSLAVLLAPSEVMLLTFVMLTPPLLCCSL